MRRSNRTAWTLIALTLAGVMVSSIVLVGGLRASEGATSSLVAGTLPPGCVKPAGGFLILASKYGYNDSVLEGASPSTPWPVITVTQGQHVKITVCNVDSLESHGFQIANYFDKSVVSIAPGKVLTVSFVADQAGDFQIFCAIFCTIHLFMQYGQLRVES